MRRGTPNQLIAELEDKIADLKGVESSVDVCASEEYKIRFYAQSGPDKGNLDHEETFSSKEDALRKYREVFDQKLYNLNPTVWEKSGDGWRRLMGKELVESAAQVIDDGEDVIQADEDAEEIHEDVVETPEETKVSEEVEYDDTEEYLNDLYAGVEDNLADLLEEVSWTGDEDNIYMDVSFQDGHVFTFTIPREDLVYDLENMDTDVDYICKAVRGVDEEDEVDETVSEEEYYPEDWYDEDGNPPVTM